MQQVKTQFVGDVNNQSKYLLLNYDDSFYSAIISTVIYSVVKTSLTLLTRQNYLNLLEMNTQFNYVPLYGIIDLDKPK